VKKIENVANITPELSLHPGFEPIVTISYCTNVHHPPYLAVIGMSKETLAHNR
jgi:hypothetical protein